jgi:epoxyqueuosine reductase
MRAEDLKRLAREEGFELAGIAAAEPLEEAASYARWVAAGMAGKMGYLEGERGRMRGDPRTLFPSARSILCVGKLYNTPLPYSTEFDEPGRAWISRYAWGEDYHQVLRRGLERVAARLPSGCEWKICVDTAPLLERGYARRAGLGWIGKNTCLIREGAGSWFFLAELLLSLELEADSPPPDRCGSCTRCIDACPTGALVPAESGWALDSRRCISYWTIELRGPAPEEARAAGRNVFGCDICQDVCPWNRRAPFTAEAAFQAREFAPPLERMAALTADEFRAMFRGTPVSRARYAGFLRNVIVAMAASGAEKFRPALGRLAEHAEPLVRNQARAALGW